MDSPYASSYAMGGRSALPIADLAAPGVLETALHRRSYLGELILFSFDFCGIAEALSLVLQLFFEHTTMRCVAFYFTKWHLR